MSTIKVTNLRHESATSNNIALDSSNNVTTANNFTAGGTIGCTGDLTITSGNLVVSSGNGIDFSATGDGSGTASSELFDDYEEGTWTPVYNFSTSGDAQTNSVGSYVKVGSKVYIQCYIEINGTNSLSGNVLITGLPYAAANVTNRRAGFTIANAWNFPGDDNPLRLLVEPNASGIKMFNNATNATEARMTNANFTAQAGKNTIMFSGTYTV